MGNENIILPIVRKMINHRVYPVHRLDRKTSGVLLFAKTKECQALMNAIFRNQGVHKTYRAIVRGYLSDSGTIDYELKNDRGKVQEAVTHFEALQKTEIPIASGKFPTSRYTYVHLVPETGRQHQLRKHMAHIFHPIIGDRPHGCNKQNRFFLEQFQLSQMMLHALTLSFEHPYHLEKVEISAGFPTEMKRIASVLGIQL